MTIIPFSKSRFWERGINFSPECGSKVVKRAKNDRLDMLIVLARDEGFSFLPWKLSKGGIIGWFFAFFCRMKPFIFTSLLLLYYMLSSEYDYSTSWNEFICITGHSLALFKYNMSHINIQLWPSSLVLLFFVVVIIIVGFVLCFIHKVFIYMNIHLSINFSSIA